MGILIYDLNIAFDDMLVPTKKNIHLLHIFNFFIRNQMFFIRVNLAIVFFVDIYYIYIYIYIYFFRLGQTSNHITALLFKLDHAWQTG